MAYALGIPLMVLLAILQSAVSSQVRLIAGQVDLVLLAVVAWGLTGRWREAMILGLVGGIGLDLLSALPIGISSLALVLIAYAVSITEGRLWGAHLLTPLGVVLAASVAFSGFTLVGSLIAGAAVDLAAVTSRIILPGLFLNLLLAIPAAQLASAVQRMLFPPKVEIA
jgi:rod shape-determining protein MreD